MSRKRARQSTGDLCAKVDDDQLYLESLASACRMTKLDARLLDSAARRGNSYTPVDGSPDAIADDITLQLYIANFMLADDVIDFVKQSLAECRFRVYVSVVNVSVSRQRSPIDNRRRYLSYDTFAVNLLPRRGYPSVPPPLTTSVSLVTYVSPYLDLKSNPMLDFIRRSYKHFHFSTKSRCLVPSVFAETADAQFVSNPGSHTVADFSRNWPRRLFTTCYLNNIHIDITTRKAILSPYCIHGYVRFVDENASELGRLDIQEELPAMRDFHLTYVNTGFTVDVARFPLAFRNGIFVQLHLQCSVPIIFGVEFKGVRYTHGLSRTFPSPVHLNSTSDLFATDRPPISELVHQTDEANGYATYLPDPNGYTTWGTYTIGS